jgi:iron(III) transport system ATP-binding protein
LLRIRELLKTYKTTSLSGVPAVAGVSVELRQGEFYTLLGASGCGKTTTLRCVAGLEKPDAGEIFIGDTLIYSSERKISLPTHKRHVGMVFQSYAVWPHMNVFENLAFPLIAKGGLSPQAVREKVREALKLVQLNGYEDRPAPFLSGGQQQRVALARALIYEPSVLLLDEPLSNLDAKLRSDMRFELKQLTRRLNLTTLYVTHDQLEALSLSDRIAVMNRGVILQEGTPQEIYRLPANSFVANFIGSGMNMLEATVVAAGDSRVQLESRWGPFECIRPTVDFVHGDKALIGIRPESFEVCVGGHAHEGSSNTVEARVEVATFTGDGLEFQALADSKLIRGRTNPWINLEIGQQIYLHCPPERCLLLSSAESFKG